MDCPPATRLQRPLSARYPCRDYFGLFGLSQKPKADVDAAKAGQVLAAKS